jgi:ribosomal protein S18 acetylase RimI-like enzyme
MNPIALSIGQMVSAWKRMCMAAPARALASLTGMELLFSRLPVPFFNVIVQTEPVDSAGELSNRSEEACAAAARHGVPWFFVVHDALAPGIDVPSTLDAHGLVPLMPLTGMLAEDVAALDRAPAGLELTVPQDDGSSAAIVDLNSAAYGMDLKPCMPVLGSQGFWRDNFAVVGKIDGTPVSCAAVMVLDGYRYVGFVATHPDHQRRGYADAAMRLALERAVAKTGARPTVLHATEAGRPVYARMGYEPISTLTLFLESRFLEGH